MSIIDAFNAQLIKFVNEFEKKIIINYPEYQRDVKIYKLGLKTLLITNNILVFTGSLDKLSRDEAKHLALKLGAKILSKNKKNKLEEVTFVFSNFLISKHKKAITDIIFGYQLKSYVFNKYLSLKKNNLNAILLNLYKLKKIME